MILPMTKTSFVISRSSSLPGVVVGVEGYDLGGTILGHGNSGAALGQVELTLAPSL